MATRTFTNVQALLSAINQEMTQAMTEVSLQGLIKSHENAQDFYSEGGEHDGEKGHYKRTGTYGTAPNSTGVQKLGNTVSTEIYMEEAGHGYRTGTFSAREVWQAAEDHTAGVTGKPGRWQQTEQDVEKLANEVFAEHFN